jgi:hypothetical protein
MELNELHDELRNRRRILGGHGGRARRLAAFAVLATAVLGATAACTGSSSPTGLGGTSTAGTSMSPTAPSTSAGASASASVTSIVPTVPPTTTTSAAANGSNSGSAASPHAASGGTAACTGSEIKVTAGQSSAGMSHDALPLVFTNASSRSCTMQGYPGAAIMSGSTTVLNSTRSLNGYVGDERQLSSAPLVTLAPGTTASAMLEWVVDAGETCYPGGSGKLEVTPPNTTSTTSLISLTAGSGGVCASFEIHPVVSGTLS